MSQNTDLIERFIASWKSMNIEQIMGFFADDAVYVNIPMEPPNVGREMIRKAIEGFIGMSKGIEFVVYHTAENPAAGIVMNERVDRFNTGQKWIEARVVGIFEIRDGKIKAWRDYFDLAEFQRQITAPGS
jgi:limonene-1,2-epoxide hydrolase